MKTRKLDIIAIIALTLFVTGCTNESITGNKINLEKLTKNLTKNNVFVDPIHKNLELKTTKNILGDTEDESTRIPTSRNDLYKMRVVVKIYNGKDNAGISVPGFGGLKLGKDESNLNVYYIETKVVNRSNDSIVYGCGYSLHYLFKKVERGISIDNIPSVAASVQLNSNKTQVYYSLQTYGIIGSNLVKYFKPTINKNFNVEGFGIMQSSIDGIHNILGDTTLSKTVKFKPEILKFIKPYELEQIE